MSNWLANEETRNIPNWPRETGNLPAPASGSVIKAVFEMSQKMPLLSRILHLRVVGNINLPGVRNKKELTVILWKGLFTHANHASTVCITYIKIFNWTKGVLMLNASYLTLSYCGRLREHAWHTENTKIITWWKKREAPGKHTELKLMYFELEGEKDTEEAPSSHFVGFTHLCISLMMCNFPYVLNIYRCLSWGLHANSVPKAAPEPYIPTHAYKHLPPIIQPDVPNRQALKTPACIKLSY